MTGVYDACPECQSKISQQPGRGKARKYCSPQCQAAADKRRLDAQKKALPICAVDGCGMKAVRVGAQMCEKHYMRMRRNETTEYVGRAIPGKLEHSHGYVLVPAAGHPRALGGYRAYEHRVVFTDAHGEGPFNCHWCSKVVTWSDMHVDHVDADKANNDLSNLVASCADCNQRRGHEKIRETWRKRNGVTINGVTRTLNEWAEVVGLRRSSIVARLKAGWDIERAVFEPRGKFGPKQCNQIKSDTARGQLRLIG